MQLREGPFKPGTATKGRRDAVARKSRANERKKPGSVSTDLASNDRCNYRQRDIVGGNAEYVKSKKKTKKRGGIASEKA